MVNSSLICSKPGDSEFCSFKRREQVILPPKQLWFIESGAVRTYTLTTEGTIIALGFWGTGDTVGSVLACVQPYIVECLAEVQARSLPTDQCRNLSHIVLSHLHQTQELLRVRSGSVPLRLQELLDWLANKFGRASDQGTLIQIRLTHQDIADTLGTTRVTITRLLNQLEQDGQIRWMQQYLLLPPKRLDAQVLRRTG
ncbi:MAG: Crp/Fnr family transcriptional regulator [Oculatellaceae cyanobacterium Prado106]|jgi:CRP-like cAMP-binding protein|nr:Crp/Fnr family transcriptional regulator [Oculatellaceae cyanobacterium Prado106]